MKQRLPFALLILTSAFIIGCSSMQGMYITVQRPATITVDQNIQSIALLNRAIASDKINPEGILTMELPKRDKELSEECLNGINEMLLTSKRFEVKRCEKNMLAANPASLDFGATLDWAQVDSICSLYKVDGLLSLEFFDTDYSIINPGATVANTATNVLNGNGASVQVSGKANARAGFRLYYPKTQTIVYQDRYTQNRTWVQTSTNPAEAIAKLIKKNDALIEVSYYTGKSFAHDLVPLYFRENRQMYKGKKGQMERAQRQGLAQDWEGAIATWEDVYNTSGKSKIRAKAAYNIAFGYEVLGDLEKAKKWIQTAYVEGGKSEAYDYSQIIDKRLREQGRLSEQNGK